MATLSTASPTNVSGQTAPIRFCLVTSCSRPGQQVFEHGERLGPELDGFGAAPETLVDQVERERSEINATFVGHGLSRVTEALPRRYD